MRKQEAHTENHSMRGKAAGITRDMGDFFSFRSGRIRKRKDGLAVLKCVKEVI